MKNSKTPKIVVGVGLVAVYASIAGYYTLRGGQDSMVTQSPPSTAPTPTTADPSLASPAFPELADTLASPDALVPEVSPPAATPADAPFGKDGQITADVKSQVEAVAPGGAIDVTTRDGVVELAGSVPNQDAFDKAWLAARNARDVRDVDASALTISN